jgi:hypothetical protein
MEVAVRFRVAMLALALVVIASSCDGLPPTYRVAGDISWEGVPVEDGQITFLPEDPNVHPASVKIVKGKYEARVHAGWMKVEVHGQKDLGYDPTMGQNKRGHYIAHEYNLQTTLRYEVHKHNDNIADFHLPLKK